MVLSLLLMLLVLLGPSFERAYSSSAFHQSAAQLQSLQGMAHAYGNAHHCLPLSVGPTPQFFPKAPVRVTWEDPSWKALGFAPEEVQGRFQMRSEAMCKTNNDETAPPLGKVRAAVFKVGLDPENTGNVTSLELTSHVEYKDNAAPFFGSHGIARIQNPYR